MPTVVFQSKKSARLRIKIKESNISGYRPDGKAIYDTRAKYAEFTNMLCVLDDNLPEQAEMIESLRKHRNNGIDFREVKEGEVTAKKGEDTVVKYSKAVLSAMNKAELAETAKTVGAQVNVDDDKKPEIIKAIMDKYKAL